MASGAAEEPEAGTLSLVFENDLFYDTDRNYTNGVRASWLSGPDRTPAWALRAARWFPLFPDGGTVRTSYAVGQNMYTPEDIALRDPPPRRPPLCRLALRLDRADRRDRPAARPVGADPRRRRTGLARRADPEAYPRDHGLAGAARLGYPAQERARDRLDLQAQLAWLRLGIGFRVRLRCNAAHRRRAAPRRRSTVRPSRRSTVRSRALCGRSKTACSSPP